MDVDASQLEALKQKLMNRSLGSHDTKAEKFNSNQKAFNNNSASGRGSRFNYSNNKNVKQSSNNVSGKGRGANTNMPTAPYNFIKLNDKVVQPPLATAIGNATDVDDVIVNYTNFINSGIKYSGYFDVRVKNITPLYIAGAEGFFSNGKDICIPGSSMRGCLKNTFKIITNSAFRSDKENPDLTNKHLYFRSFASKDIGFKQLYLDRMMQNVNGKLQNIAEAGFIVYKDKKYYVCPAELTIEKGIRETLLERHADPIKLFVGINPNLRDGACVKWHDKYVDVFTGNIDRKKSFYRFSKVQWNKLLTISEDLIEEYLDDTTRKGVMVIPSNDEHKKELLRKGIAINPQMQKNKKIRQDMISCYGVNNIVSHVYQGKNILKDYSVSKTLLEEKKNIIRNKYASDARDQEISYPQFLCGAEEYTYVVPCFYVAENGIVKHFGFNRYYRIPYLKTIAEHIPKEINCNVIDFADAVFGRKSEWSSRVFFEDMYLDAESKGNMEGKEYRKILANPNPTSFQFYLDKKGDKASFWDGNNNIRGYKMYWHKDIAWQETNTKFQNDKMTSQIIPLSKGNNFVGRIRFENLDQVELGALCALFALGGEDGICYKLGMGKPIGMGTIKLGATLYIQDERYYSTLFDDNGFAECIEKKDLRKFADVFNTYMQKQLTGYELALYNDRMKELRLIMSTANMQKPGWNNQTRYMDINSKDDKGIMNARTPLPTISEVVGVKK